MYPEIKKFKEAIGALEMKPEHKELFKRPNYFRFKTQLDDALLIVKISRIPIPFYGVDSELIKGAIDHINKVYLVLLRNEKEGWVYSEIEINTKINNKVWSLSQNNYKINKYMLDDSNYFTSIEQFLNKVK